MIGAMDRRRFVVTLAGAAVPLAAARDLLARPAATPALQAKLHALLDGYVGAKKLAGALVGVSTNGEPVAYVRAGHVALDADEPFDERSVCRIASMSKPVTGIAAMCLIEDGKVRLDQPVADVIPELKNLQVVIDIEKGLEARPATAVVTMRHLLTHTSGLGYWTPVAATDAITTAFRARGLTPGNYGARLNRPGFGPQAVGLDEMVKRLAELPLFAEPGTAYRYSIGLDVMGLVIERVSGKTLEAFYRERLFAPLKMASSGLQVPASAAARLTTNYDVTPGGLIPIDRRDTSVWLKPPTLAAGGGGLVSTAADYVRFIRMLFGGGALDGVRVLKSETVRLACSNLLPAGVTGAEGGFGAGMRVGLTGATAGELGWQGAAGTFWRAQPARRRILILMTQHMPPLSYPLWDEVGAAFDAA
jgi:CubicO group peptidase (beta-lactamase class C family)